jgi:phosphoribosylaminoimidazole-succinocarboxamide synthase
MSDARAEKPQSAGTPTVVRETALPLPLVRRGKVRDVYEVDADTLLLVTTDRISAFDVVMNEAIPFKGAVLTQMTAWWLRNLKGVRHHMISADIAEIIKRVPSLAPYQKELAGRSMLSVRTNVYPIECVVRGYLSGSGWKEYRANGTLGEEPLPPGLRESDRLPEPRFTPATKAESGHDENISREKAMELIGPVARELEQLALSIYDRGRALAEWNGIIIADTKFEFGERDGEIILIDEVMTPDSSRFWAADTYRPGTAPPSFDKQPLRDYLESERQAGRWNGDAPPPPLPADVVDATSARYLDAFRRITGRPLDLAGLT